MLPWWILFLILFFLLSQKWKICIAFEKSISDLKHDDIQNDLPLIDDCIILLKYSTFTAVCP